MVTVEARFCDPDWLCEVKVTGPGTPTRHQVTVTPAELERWGRGGSAQDLVRRSFDFLLQREPPQSILPRFQISDIQRYFPDFDQVI